VLCEVNICSFFKVAGSSDLDRCITFFFTDMLWLEATLAASFKFFTSGCGDFCVAVVLIWSRSSDLERFGVFLFVSSRVWLLLILAVSPSCPFFKSAEFDRDPAFFFVTEWL
jgi:hypothetical protein